MNATARPVKFRQVQRVGVDETLGVGGTVSVIDTLVDPQPSVKQISAAEVASTNGLLQLGDYRMTFAGTVPESTFQDDLILYGTDVLKAKSWVSSPFQGVVIKWTVIARAVKA